MILFEELIYKTGEETTMNRSKVIPFLLILSVIVMGAMYFKVNSDRYSTFDSISEAEETLGKIKLPDIGEDYKIKTIKYYNDDFTHPRTTIYYENPNGKKIIFMIVSDYSSTWIDYKKIQDQFVADMTWIEKHTLEYEAFENTHILQWRKSNKESYKYLVTQDVKDKEWLIRVAKEY